MGKLFNRILSESGKAEPDAFELLNALSPRQEEVLAHEAAHSADTKTILCRETIVNRDERVVGHEFMLKKAITNRVYLGHAMRRLYDQALVSQLVGMPMAQLLGHRFALVSFEAQHIFDPNLQYLPAAQCVLILRFGEDDVSAEVVEQVTQLKQIGLRFGITAHECANGGMAQLVNELEFAVLDLQEEWTFAADVVQWLSDHTHLQLIACHIDSSEAFDSVRHSTLLGDRVAYFQGPFISARSRWEEQAPQVMRSQVLLLLHLIRTEAGTLELVDALKADPILFYKLLRMVNSPALALAQEVTTAEQVLKTLGRDSLYRWLTLLLYSADTNPIHDLHFLDAALLRARMLENLGLQRLGKEEAEQLFLMGTLSLMDALLQKPLAQALQVLVLPEAISTALLKRQGPYFPYLQLALAVEIQDKNAIARLGSALGLSVTDILRCRSDALLWLEKFHR
ncbi:HDOD domain-containing protein [Chitinibacter bivalviorum]|uniref:HDOD domain-containing protein n=1 Tax=Chitinibacter bivalviorum TaxID=2739434 RepID=A0A7H9BQX0_9NEIS|nr:HDOD domain-containing protein [Chitinibacter bivalviorum]QLG89624.1 HDOD domain-containing protein [Chitinibacter bivalviorum]